MMKKILLPVCYLLLTACISHAQPHNHFNTERLDSLFSRIETNDMAMGSVSIFQGGREVYQRSFGYSDFENGIKANAGTKYRIASMSKTFTAAVILKLVEEGKLSLTDKLSKYYPEVPGSDNITIENMLCHQSGITDYLTVDYYGEWTQKPVSKESLLARIVSYPSKFNPGSKFSYSNSNYVLLVWIAEDASGRSFGDLFERYIRNPLKLKDTYVGLELHPEKNEAKPYHLLDTWSPSIFSHPSTLIGAGSMVSTPRDLNTFFYALMHGKVVSEESLKKMMVFRNTDGTIASAGYGLGLENLPYPPMRMYAYGHRGGINQYCGVTKHFPDGDVTASVTLNTMEYAYAQIMADINGIIFNWPPYKLPDFQQRKKVPDGEAERYTGTYSAENMSFKFTVSAKNNYVIIEGMRVGKTALRYIGDRKFNYQNAVTVEFYPEQDKLTWQQKGAKDIILRRTDR